MLMVKRRWPCSPYGTDMKILFIITALFYFSTAMSKEEQSFRPDYWSKGLHLAAGGGLNAVYFFSDDLSSDIGYGLNMKTDLGYYLSSRFAIEGSANVKFNRIERYLVWDTLITAGIRYRIKEDYVRAFYGRAPTVIFFNKNPPKEYEHSRASRLQYDGPVFGVAYGKMFKRDTGTIWFWETAATLQNLENREAIHMDGQVPEVIERKKDKAHIVSLFFMVGILIF